MAGIQVQDFVHGVDLSAYPTIAGADINNEVDLAYPAAYRGLNLITTDSALNTPAVPTANITTKWKTYIWIRVPHPSASVQTPALYSWNDNAPNDATLLHWVNTTFDPTAILASITALTAALAVTTATANSAYNMATAVTTTANTALTNSNTAVTVSNNANTTAQNALNAANVAAPQITSLQGQVNSLIAFTTNGPFPVSKVTFGTAGQRLRTNAAASAPEWYSEIDNTIIYNEVYASGVNASGTLTSVNTYTRNINNKVLDTLGAFTVAAGIFTCNIAGTYRIRGKFPVVSTGGFPEQSQVALMNSATNTVLQMGTGLRGAGEYSWLFVDTVLTLATGAVIRFDQYISNAGLGTAANIFGSNALFNQEVYSLVELTRIL